MQYKDVVPASFVVRENRFVAQVCLAGAPVRCHVKNTGRLRELLIPGAEVYVSHSASPGRSTAYDLIAVRSGGRLVNIDSSAPNVVFTEWAAQSGVLGDVTYLKREAAYGGSRLDFAFAADGRQGYGEIKGVTLVRDGIALFPDAPTLRGLRHVQELIHCAQAGLRAVLAFVVQMDGITRFMPNDAMQPAFGEAVREAARQGVQVVAVNCTVTPDSIAAKERIAVLL